MNDTTRPTYQLSAERPYFIYDPAGNWFEYFETKEDRDAHSVVIIASYLEDGWHEEVSNVFAGKITARATQVDVIHPIGDLDEEGCDETGEWFDSSWDYKCNYELKPLG